MDDDEFLSQLVFSSNSSLSRRKNTFLNAKLPFKSPTVDSLVDAGFYYQNEDAVQCWACGIVLDGWEPDDDPLDQHKEHSPDCPIFSLPDRNNPTVKELIQIRVALFKQDTIKNYVPYAILKYQDKMQSVKESFAVVTKRLKMQDR